MPGAAFDRRAAGTWRPTEPTVTDREVIDEIARRRTFAIISHPDAGKTTLTEKLLLFGGAIQLAGAVKGSRAARHATSDWMELEKQRGISVTSSVMQFPYAGRILNLLDTPGHEDFSEDTYRTLTAVDSALMVVDGARGVEARTVKLMEVCRLRDTPIVTFVNKMDRESREPIELLDEIERVLGLQCAPVTWPIGSGRRFKGVYHLVDDRVHLFSPRHDGRIVEGETIRGIGNPALDEGLGVQARELREEVELVRGASHAPDPGVCLAAARTPVFFGSALNNFGVRELLDTFVELAPPPGARTALLGGRPPWERGRPARPGRSRALQRRHSRESGDPRIPETRASAGETPGPQHTEGVGFSGTVSAARPGAACPGGARASAGETPGPQREVAPAPGARASGQRTVAPGEDRFSGFVFKIQANMDPRHHDRVAFLRITSGRYRRGMRMRHVRTGKDVQVANAITFMARDRERADDAYAGDVIGLHNHGTIRIGDTFTQGETLKFTGIPNFAPELFRRVMLRDPLRLKALRKGLDQLGEEGATQVFRPLAANDLILGAVGVLQFDVVAWRLRNEYGVESGYEPAGIATARWVTGEDPGRLEDFRRGNASRLALDSGGNLAYLAPSMVNLNLAIERWPGIEFHATREI